MHQLLGEGRALVRTRVGARCQPGGDQVIKRFKGFYALFFNPLSTSSPCSLEVDVQPPHGPTPGQGEEREGAFPLFSQTIQTLQNDLCDQYCMYAEHTLFPNILYPRFEP